MGTASSSEVASHFDITVQKASQYLGRARKAGVISQEKRGEWSGISA
jgi:predicted transcriptional regulator